LRISGLVAVAVLLAWAVVGLAGTERFDYDSLGRLVRHIDSTGTITEYAYDAVGNILEVRRSNDAGPPLITSVLPAAVRRGQTVGVQITGARLTGARVTSSDQELGISALRSSATSVGFTLNASLTAALGVRVFTLSASTGDAIFSLMIEPPLPTLSLSPSPLGLTSGQSKQLTITLSSPDQVAHTLSLAIADPAVASVLPATITLTAGQTQAGASVSAVGPGTTTLNVDSNTLRSATLGIYVTVPFTGDSTAYSPLVGVVRPEPGALGLLTAPNVGVVRPEAPGGGASALGPFIAPDVGVVRSEAAASSGSPIGPIMAPNVGVQRE